MLARLRAARLLLPLLTTLAMLPPLVGLGWWQLERKTWKEGLISRLAQRVKAEPVDLATARAKWHLDKDVEYLHVTARGRFHHDKERYLYEADPKLGPGVAVLTPLEIADGSILWVNRGYVPDRLKDSGQRREGQAAGDTVVTGLARLPAEAGFMTPANDVARNLWFWRDVPALHASAFPRGTPATLPFMLEADSVPPNPGGWPLGGRTILAIPNRHLEYALTWFGLAGALIAVFVVYARSRLAATGTP